MRDDLEKRLRDLGRKIGPDDAMTPDVMNRIDAEFGNQPVRTERAKNVLFVRRLVMSKVTRYAAAAVIVIGAFAGYQMFKGTADVSWAEVRARVAAVRAVMYEADISGSEGEQPFAVRVEGSQADDYGTRTNVYMGDELISRSFALTGEKSFVTLYPGQKKYSVVELTEAIRRQDGNPKVMVEAFLQGDYKELGHREIGGVAAEGVESRGLSLLAGFPGSGAIVGSAGEREMPGEAVGRLWVDAATGWPVQVTLNVTDDAGKEQIAIVVHDFQWDARVDPTVFDAAIPQGYELLYQIDVGRLESGKQLAEGLAYFAEFSGGRYPAKLTVGDILGEVGAIYAKRKADGAAVQVNDDQVANLKLGANYVRRLKAEGKEPVYYGETVTPADVDKVLLRWRLQDGQYRVIFGDLRIEDVTGERLGGLERG